MTGLKYFHKSMKQETLPHTVSLTQDHEISVPRHQLTHPAAAIYLWVYVGASLRTTRILTHLDLAH